MQSENFDNKIKDSLSQRPPGNEPPEWDKMQTLLDRHLPVEKKDRRRIVFILFLFLLLGGGAFFVWKNTGTSGDNISESKSNKVNSTPNNTPDKSTENNGNKTEPTVKEIPQNSSGETPSSQKSDRSSIQQETTTTQKNNKNIVPKSEKATSVIIQNADVKVNPNKRNKQVTKKGNIDTQPITPVEKNNNQQNIPAVIDKQKADDTQKITDLQKSEEVQKKKRTRIHS